jgi:hypothetical protein
MCKLKLPKDSILLVSVNGTFGTAFRKGVKGAKSDIVVFTPNVEGHDYWINHVKFDGSYQLHGAPCSPNRSLLDYDLDGRVFSVDTLKYPVDKNVTPQGWMQIPYPDFIIPHRLLNIAFRDGATAGPHGCNIPGAVLFCYEIKTDTEVWVSGQGQEIPPTPLNPLPNYPNIYIYSLVASGPDDEAQSLTHARDAWSQFSSHCNGLSCELFLVTECNPDGKIPDRFGITDHDVERDFIDRWPQDDDERAEPIKLESKPANCKTQNTFLLNGTTETISWHPE